MFTEPCTEIMVPLLRKDRSIECIEPHLKKSGKEAASWEKY